MLRTTQLQGKLETQQAALETQQAALETQQAALEARDATVANLETMVASLESAQSTSQAELEEARGRGAKLEAAGGEAEELRQQRCPGRGVPLRAWGAGQGHTGPPCS